MSASLLPITAPVVALGMEQAEDAVRERAIEGGGDLPAQAAADCGVPVRWASYTAGGVGLRTSSKAAQPLSLIGACAIEAIAFQRLMANAVTISSASQCAASSAYDGATPYDLLGDTTPSPSLRVTRVTVRPLRRRKATTTRRVPGPIQRGAGVHILLVAHTRPKHALIDFHFTVKFHVIRFDRNRLAQLADKGRLVLDIQIAAQLQCADALYDLHHDADGGHQVDVATRACGHERLFLVTEKRWRQSACSELAATELRVSSEPERWANSLAIGLRPTELPKVS